MRISILSRQVMALVVGGVSVFVVPGCQEENKPSPLPNLPASTTPVDSTTKPNAPPTTGKSAASAASGARQPRFGEASPKK
jgi:hypothetical protein